jgi:uncharacterized protein
MEQFLPFLFLAASFATFWIHKDPKGWGIFLLLSIGSGFVEGNVHVVGICFILVLFGLWILYAKKTHLVLFLLLVVLSACFKMKLIPGFQPLVFSPKFSMDLSVPIIGLFPLFLVPLAANRKDWISAFNGLLWGCLGIAILAVLATMGEVAHWCFKMPTFAPERIFNNLFLVAVPEEAFYRGFLQRTLCRYFGNIRFGRGLALGITTVLFTAAHVFWSPDLSILAFVFLAGLLYGGVYLISNRIESAILTHFLLNLIHMVFFTYHAM